MWEDLGDPDECRAIHKLEANDVDVDDSYTCRESGFVVGSQILVLKDTFEEETTRQRGEADHYLECLLAWSFCQTGHTILTKHSSATHLVDCEDCDEDEKRSNGGINGYGYRVLAEVRNTIIMLALTIKQ